MMGEGERGFHALAKRHNAALANAPHPVFAGKVREHRECISGEFNNNKRSTSGIRFMLELVETFTTDV